MSKLTYNLSEVARLTGRGRSTLYEAIGQGRLKARKSGRCTVVLASDLQAFLESLPDAVACGAVRPAPQQKAA